MKKKLAIIGASYLQEPLVVRAKELGIETLCFAWEEGAVCKNIADIFFPISIIEKEKILEICTNYKIDGIVSIASDVSVPTVSFVAEKLNIIGNSVQSSLISTNKYEMRRRFQENNVNSPVFLRDNDLEARKLLHFPCIVKPVDRSGSLGVVKVNNNVELEEAVDNAKSKSLSGHAIIEEFVSGYEVSVETISWQGEHFILAITDKKTTGEPYFVELEHHQPSNLNEAIQNKIKLITVKALNALEIKYGASHSEFKITENGEIFAIEVGGRMGGDFIGSHLVKLSTGFDFLEGVIQISLGKFDNPKIENSLCSGVYFLSKETENLLTYFDENKTDKRIVQMERTAKDLKNIRCSADRSGYFIYKANERMEI